MSTKNTTTTVDTKAIAAADKALTVAVGQFIESFAQLAKSVEDAAEAYKAAGLSDKETAEKVKAVFEAAGQRKLVNKYLRAAGVRQRAVRCDAGLAGFALRFSTIPKAKGEKESAEKLTPTQKLVASAMRLADDDKAAAIKALKAAIAAIESAE